MSVDAIEMAQAFYESQNPGSRWHRLSWVEKVHYAALAEREACAVVCEKLPETFRLAAKEFGYQPETPTAENYATAIRTRSDT
jgi:hypothetical protein